MEIRLEVLSIIVTAVGLLLSCGAAVLTALLTVIGWYVTYEKQKQIVEMQKVQERMTVGLSLGAPVRISQLLEFQKWVRDGFISVGQMIVAREKVRWTEEENEKQKAEADMEVLEAESLKWQLHARHYYEMSDRVWDKSVKSLRKVARDFVQAVTAIRSAKNEEYERAVKAMYDGEIDWLKYLPKPAHKFYSSYSDLLEKIDLLLDEAVYDHAGIAE